jgi:hypothetical protein
MSQIDKTLINRNLYTKRTAGLYMDGQLTGIALPTGTAALVANGLRAMATQDRADANAAGDIIRNENLTVTVTADNGASVVISGNTAVGQDFEQTSWNQISMPQALRASLALAGAMAPHIEQRIVDMLTAVQDGMDWDEAFETVVGEALSEERTQAVDARIADLRRETVSSRRGRQQASQVSVTGTHITE